MTPSPGERLGRYELVAPLGEGGMGVVWRARDTQLARTVALKLIRPERAGEPTRRARFAKEAAAVARLTHPHVATLYDYVVHDGVDVLAMEYLQGPTLQARLLGHPTGLLVPEALAIAVAVGDALAYAHAQHVVHRDVKPANILLASVGVKLLDFGIAILDRDEATSVAASTATAVATGMDVSGTLPYMAPEQLDGRADARSDVFALGAVVFEMLTGRRPFAGATAPDVLAALLAADRPILPGAFVRREPGLAHAVHKCLALDPLSRWQSMADFTDYMRWLAHQPAGGDATSTAPPPRRGSRTALAAGALLAALVGAIGGWRAAARPPTATASHLFFALSPDQTFGAEGLGPELAVSPDGAAIVYVASQGARSQLFVRSLDAGQSRPIPGTEGARGPFFSPDGQSIGYFAENQIRRLQLPEGLPQVVCASGSGEAEWGRDGVIRFATYSTNQPIQRVAATGGVPEPITTVGPSDGHFAPQYLADTGAMLYSVRHQDASGVTFHVMLQPPAGAPRRILDGAQRARRLASRALVYQVDSQILRVPFDAGGAAPSGAPAVVVGDVPSGDFNIVAWAAGPDVLVYRSGAARQRRLVWTDRTGAIEPLQAPLRQYSSPRLSPDDRRVAVEVSAGANFDVWLLDLAREALTPFTVDHVSRYPQWTPDGRSVVVSRRKVDGHDLYWREVDGAGDLREVLRGGNGGTYAESWSRDGRSLVYWESSPQTGADVWEMDLRGTRPRRALVQTSDPEVGGRLSPDGRWLAYLSSRSGRPELFVKAYADAGLGQQISTDGAREAVWARNSRELFFRNNNQMLAVSVAPDALAATKPAVLFNKAFYQYGGQALVHYDVAADGRFLMIEELDATRPEIGVIQGLSAQQSTASR